MFSSRVPHLEPNSLSRAVERARSSGRRLLDLTLTNPTRAGFRYPAELFLPLSNAAAAIYTPRPFGLTCAREAVAAEYGRRGVRIPWEQIALTSSTSEAYSLLFKLLCAPSGDSVLVPVPSYPLFEHLTRLDGVATTPYRLEYDGRWWIDFRDLDAQWTGRTRAVLSVSPNNPTGSVLTRAEIGELHARCAARDAALILDEVFADYELEASLSPISNSGPEEPPGALTFRLGGLSKSAALPQLKLAWIAIDGPESLVTPAQQRLEVICDTYLSVATPVQLAAADLLKGAPSMRRQVCERVLVNYGQLRDLASRHASVDVLRVEAGWSAVLRVPSRGTEEELVTRLVDREGIVVYPGFFFDFSYEAFLVVSLLPEPELFRHGMRRVLECVDG